MYQPIRHIPYNDTMMPIQMNVSINVFTKPTLIQYQTDKCINQFVKYHIHNSKSSNSFLRGGGAVGWRFDPQAEGWVLKSQPRQT